MSNPNFDGNKTTLKTYELIDSTPPGNPDAGKVVLYSNGGVVYSKNSSGTTESIGSGGGGAAAEDPDRAGITWTAISTLGDNDAWAGVAYGNGIFVAVGSFTGGTYDEIATSPDGVTWTSRTGAGNDDNWNDIVFGEGLFVAVGRAQGAGGDRVMTSPDGITWTARTAVGDNDWWQAICHGNGLFVAVGREGDRVMTSPDGITWTARSAAGNNDNWQSVTYSDEVGLYVACGTQGTTDIIMTSPDAITWTTRTAPSHQNGEFFGGVAYGNGLFVAVGNTGTVFSSSDGITWAGSSIEVDCLSLVFADNIFVATGISKVLTSTDGTTWTERTSPSGAAFWQGITYGKGLFVAVGPGSGSWDNQVMISGYDTEVIERNLKVEGSITQEVWTNNVSNPPTDAELDAIFTSPADAGVGFTAYIDDNGAGTNFYQVISDGTNWWTFSGTKAV